MQNFPSNSSPESVAFPVSRIRCISLASSSLDCLEATNPQLTVGGVRVPRAQSIGDFIVKVKYYLKKLPKILTHLSRWHCSDSIVTLNHHGTAVSYG